MGQLTDYITNIPTRMYPNLFDVSISPEDITPSATVKNIAQLYAKIAKLCFSVDFGGDFSIDYDYNESYKQHFIKKANLIKSVTLSFYELGGMNVVKALQADWDSVYDIDTNSFTLDRPHRAITIYPIGNNATLISGVPITGNIILSGAKISNFKYPKFSWKDKEPIEITATYTFDRITLKG